MFSHLLCELCDPVDNPVWPAGSAELGAIARS